MVFSSLFMVTKAILVVGLGWRVLWVDGLQVLESPGVFFRLVLVVCSLCSGFLSFDRILDFC